jgi:S1-C subfamily serine protease
VIVRLAGTSIDGLEDLRGVIRARRPGDTVSVLYLRDGEPFTTSATLGAWID